MELPNSYLSNGKAKSVCIRLIGEPQSNDTALIGVSPFTGFFTANALEEIVRWVTSHYDDFRIFIPDKPTLFSLISLGYDESYAKKKSKRQCNYLKNKCLTAMRNINRKFDEDKIITYQMLERNDIFSNELNRIMSIYNYDSDFKKELEDYSTNFLKKKHKELSKKAIHNSTLYLLYELPIFLNCKKIINKKEVTFVYPSIPVLIKNILMGKSSISLGVKIEFLEYMLEYHYGNS